ncbi:MAG: hypothetical protein Q8R96_20165 [Bacteroidota bacterium]|nr:hypothetical protein [Bacteroidota bacterium]
MKPKNLFNALMAVLIIIGISACDALKKDKEETDPEKTMGKVGNYWKGYADGYPNATMTIEENVDGNVVASFPYGGKTIEVEGKVTDNGFSDYVYSNGDKTKPFVLVKFDAKVGDKWEYKIGNQTITREVVKKSTTDDTPYGFWNIKTIDVLETIPAGVQVRGATSPVKTILYKWNHKFGFVFAEITKTDNTKVVVTSMTNAGD